MLAKIRLWLDANAPFLFKDSMPVWLTVIASLGAGALAAAGTYFIAPEINRQYQIDEARGQHVAKATEGLNQEIIALSQKIRRLNEALVNESDSASSLRADCLDSVTKLQWMLVDIRVVLKSSDDQLAVRRLSNSLDTVKSTLDQSIDARAQPKLIGAMRTLGTQTRDVLNRLYVAANLK